MSLFQFSQIIGFKIAVFVRTSLWEHVFSLPDENSHVIKNLLLNWLLDMSSQILICVHIHEFFMGKIFLVLTHFCFRDALHTTYGSFGSCLQFDRVEFWRCCIWLCFLVPFTAEVKTQSPRKTILKTKCWNRKLNTLVILYWNSIKMYKN